MEMFVAPVLLCVARCASRVAMLARFLRRGCQTRGDPKSCHAFSATFAVAGAVTAEYCRQPAGWNAGTLEASDGLSTDVDASTWDTDTRAQLAP